MEKVKACLTFKLPDNIKIFKTLNVCRKNVLGVQPPISEWRKKRLISSGSFVILITAGHACGDCFACPLLLCTNSNSPKLTCSLGRHLFTLLPSTATIQQQRCCFELVLAEMPEQKWTGLRYTWLQLMGTLIL